LLRGRQKQNHRRHSWGSNPRRIAANLDLRHFNPQTITLVGHPKVIPYTKFEHFGILSYAADNSVKNVLIDPVTLTFLSPNHITSRISQDHSQYQL